MSIVTASGSNGRRMSKHARNAVDVNSKVRPELQNEIRFQDNERMKKRNKIPIVVVVARSTESSNEGNSTKIYRQ